MELDLDLMCRACMSEGKATISMFPQSIDGEGEGEGENSDESGDSVANMLRLVTGVTVRANDGLPGRLCEPCSGALQRAVAFRRMCEESDSHYQQYAAARPIKDELPPEIHYEADNMDIGPDYDDDFFMFKVEPETQIDEKVKSEAVAAQHSDHLTDKPRKPFGCELCRKSYSNGKSLRRHMGIHQGDGHPCGRCERVFVRLDHLRKHLRRVHAIENVDGEIGNTTLKKQIKHDCQHCEMNVSSKAALLKHIQDCHPDVSMKTESSTNFADFDVEISSGDDDDDDDEDETEDDKKALAQVTASAGGAVATIKEEKTANGDGETRLVLQVMYKCSVCDLKYDNQHSYAAHMTKHSGPLPKGQTQFSCPLCQRIFNKRKNLKQHLLTHNEKANKCTLCHRAFTRPDQLILHMNNHTGKKRHQCMHCDKGFNMLSTLKDHLRTHSGEKPYLCSICGKGFSQNTNLKQHLMRHSAIKPFSCTTCYAKFVSKGELDAHLRKHTGEHPFVCDTCGTGFTTSSSLVKHRRIHSGERPYACDLCPLRFTALGTLKNHRRTHTGEKPFECTHCGRAFTQKSDMVSHVRTHTGERPYVCTTCGAPYQQSSALKTHMKTHHVIKQQPAPIEIIIAPLSEYSETAM